MIKNETILASIGMIKDYKNGVHFLEETVDRVLNELKLLDAELEALQSTHEAQLKQAYINGSNSTNELIQSLYKQIEQLKDKQ